jgi:FkbM family methyltransferase
MTLLHRLKETLVTRVPERYLGPIRKLYYAHTVDRTELSDLMDGPILGYLIGPGDFVADIGASVGYYTRVFSDKVGVEGRVYCVEPLPHNASCIRFNLALWKLPNVEFHSCAVSDQRGITTICLPRHGRAGTNVYENKVSVECTEAEIANGEAVTVPVTTIDEIFGDGHRRVDLIKLDAMKHEWAGIRGSRKTIEAFKPAWLLAVYSNPNEEGSPARDLFRHMTEQYGYQVYWHDASRHALRRWRPGESKYRCWFLQPKHVAQLSAVDEISVEKWDQK